MSALKLNPVRRLISNNHRISLPRPSTWSRSISEQTSSKYSPITHPDEPAPPEVTAQIQRWAECTLIPYARPPLIISKGKGCKVWDTTGREYLDFTAGIAVNALGHADDQIAQLLAHQASSLTHSSNLFHNPYAGELAVSLVEKTKKYGGMGFSGSTQKKNVNASGCKVFFANSGAEANEGALKFARKFGKVQDPTGKKHGLVCFGDGFHGRTMGALSVTYQPKYQAPFEPLIPGVTHGKLNDVAALKDLITEETCGVIVEPIQGEGGIMEASEEFLRALRRRCDEVKAVLIFDEIQCGLGRTGHLWAHASFDTDCHPDILTMAKPLANGIPIGAILMRNEVANVIQLGDHGTTFGGGPLQTSIAHHVLQRIARDDFLARVHHAGSLLKDRLTKLFQDFPTLIAGPIRGRGLMAGMQMKQAEHVNEVVRMCRERGVLVLSCGNSTVRFVPSLIVEDQEIIMATDVLGAVLQELMRSAGR
ncbi:pyridoxal phosphate-dependent transferase [Melampsora americana]|nr:pyridoxal phosphate-dependent transferase [Melampsora americana]